MKSEKKKEKVRLLAVISLLIVFLVTPLGGESLSRSKKNFLWEAKSKTNTVYVLGSIHYLKKEMYPLDKRIEEAFDRSSILIVEANVGQVSRMDVQKLVDKAFYPAEDTIERHVSPETYGLVKKQLKEWGISLEAIQKYRPWFLALSLASIEMARLGFDPEQGIDRYFLSKAAGKKRIGELESFESQLDLFSNLSEEHQELFLLSTLKDIKILERELEKLVKAWKEGDGKTVESIVTRSVREDQRLGPVYEKLILERNQKMASKIEEYLKEKETFFVVVGAGHLIGERGIIELLRRKGFTVEQL